MAEKINQKENFLKGIIKDNPVFVMLVRYVSNFRCNLICI